MLVGQQPREKVRMMIDLHGNALNPHPDNYSFALVLIKYLLRIVAQITLHFKLVPSGDI